MHVFRRLVSPKRLTVYRAHHRNTLHAARALPRHETPNQNDHCKIHSKLAGQNCRYCALVSSQRRQLSSLLPIMQSAERLSLRATIIATTYMAVTSYVRCSDPAPPRSRRNADIRRLLYTPVAD